MWGATYIITRKAPQEKNVLFFSIEAFLECLFFVITDQGHKVLVEETWGKSLDDCTDVLSQKSNSFCNDIEWFTWQHFNKKKHNNEASSKKFEFHSPRWVVWVCSLRATRPCGKHMKSSWISFPTNKEELSNNIAGSRLHSSLKTNPSLWWAQKRCGLDFKNVLYLSRLVVLLTVLKIWPDQQHESTRFKIKQLDLSAFSRIVIVDSEQELIRSL